MDKRIPRPPGAGFPKFWTLVAGAAALSGCASVLSPQIVSPTLTGGPGGTQAAAPVASAPRNWQQPTVEEAVQMATALQGQYAQAVVEHGAVQPGLGTALIGLGAAGLFKSVTGGNPTDIAGAGVLGSAGYLWGSNFASQPRQKVYLAGIRALNCAIQATRPWAMSDDDAQQMSSDLRSASEAATRLELLLQSRAAANQPQDVLMETPGHPKPLGCGAKPAKCPTASGPSATASGSSQVNWQAECARWQADWLRQCSSLAPRQLTQRLMPAPATAEAFQAAQTVLTSARTQIRQLGSAAALQQQAGGRLWGQTTEISARVSEEVMKTEPSLGAVLGSLSSLRDVAFRVSGSSLLAPASASAGSAQSGPIKSASAGESYRAAEDMSEIDKARRQLVNATAKLAPWQMQLSAASQQTAAQVSACQVQVPAGSLQVDPDDTELSLGKGQQQVFYVLGGSGVPVGTVTGKGGAAADALVRDIDAQGRFRFTYKAGDAAKPGDELQIRFSDAAGQSAPRITLHILDAATGNKAGSVTDAAVEAAKRAPADDWVALGFASKDDNKANDFVTLVLKCQGMLGAAVTAADGQMNEPVRKALKEGRCEKAPPK